jgi:hypothetical protein
VRKKKLFVKIICDAPEDVFSEDWRDIANENKNIIQRAGGIGCEGTGNIGLYCNGCPFTEYMGEWEED